MPEAERYTLDTSAVMAYFANEAGAEKVEAILSLAERRKAEVFASFMTYFEVPTRAQGPRVPVACRRAAPP